MEEKTKIYVVVTHDTDSNQITSHKAFKTDKEAQQDVFNWYDNTKEEYDNAGVEYCGECFDTSFSSCSAYAYIEHDGITEYCEMFEEEI